MTTQDNNNDSSAAPKVDYVFTRDFLDNNRCAMTPWDSSMSC